MFVAQCLQWQSTAKEQVMSKGMNQKKDSKKKPEKTLKEKRLEKTEKKKSV